MLTEAENLGRAGSILCKGDAWRMPLPDSRFDVVWGQDSWPHAEGLFEECARVAGPGGL
jgi:ubiquinone/menaquinone biosynthesis C-methylase UbiE